MGGYIMSSTINADTTNGVVVTSDTSGEIELQSNGVTKAKITANGLQDNNGNYLRGGMYRNFLINGDMKVAQRGTSASGLTSSDNGYKHIDRWRTITTAGETRTEEQSTDAPNDAEYSFKTTITTTDTSVTTNEFSQIRQVIEGLNSAHLRWGTSNAKTITVSFWVKSSVTGTYCLGLANDSFLRQYIKEYTINSANTWEKKIITITGDTSGTWDTDNGRGVCIYWSLAGGSDRQGSEGWQTPSGAGNAMITSNQVNFIGTTNATFQLALAQLEVGEGASDFEHLPYDVQLQRCQRYFSASYGNNPVGTNTWDGTVAGRNYDTSNRGENAVSIHYPVQMRALPTLTAYSKAGTSGKGVQGSTSVDTSTVERNCTLRGSETILRAAIMSVDSVSFFQFHYTANAEL